MAIDICQSAYADHVESNHEIQTAGSTVPVARMYDPDALGKTTALPTPNASPVIVPLQQIHSTSDGWDSYESTAFDASDDELHSDYDQDYEDSSTSSTTSASSSLEFLSARSLQPSQQPRTYTHPIACNTRTPCKRTPQKPGHYIEAGEVGCGACRIIQQDKIVAKMASRICIYSGCTAHLTHEDIQNKHVRCARHREKRRLDQVRRREATRAS